MFKSKAFSLVTSILIAVILFIFCALTLNFVPKSPTTLLDQGWDVTINNKLYGDVTLTEFDEILDKKLELGDHIVLAKILPDIGYIPNPTIIFKSKYTTLKCFLDGEEIYSFGDDYFQKTKFLGMQYHIITLDSDYSGKILILDMYATENNPFISLEPVRLGSHEDVSGDLVHSNLLVIATGVFMFMFGVAYMSIALLFVSWFPQIRSLLLGAIFCMNTGVWLLTYYNVLAFFVYTPLETQIEFFTLYMIVPQCYFIVYYVLDLKKSRIFKALMFVSCCVPAFQYILHYLFNIHLRVTLPLYHLNGLVGFIIFVYYLIKMSRESKLDSSAKIQMTGLLFFAISMIMHLVIYALESANIHTIPFANKLMISIGCLLFVMCQLSTYLINITEYYAKKQENISLTHLAYADGLTNLANRAKADKYMEDLDSTSDDYCIVSIDLNGLKQINDEYGHPTGDRYIKDFSKVLSNTFDEHGLCARVGGDEFIVILKGNAAEEVENLIDRMNSALNVMNALYTEYKRSVSAGFAFKHEFNNPTAHKVYMRADQRMYEQKKKMHKEMGMHTRL